jgi:hypothetical protein
VNFSLEEIMGGLAADSHRLFLSHESEFGHSPV